MTNKEKVIRAAYKLIYEKGYEDTSVDEIISKAGVSKSNFYYHFKTKQDLGLCVLELRIDNYVKDILGNTLLNFRLSPLERLDNFYARVITVHQDNKCRFGCPFGNLAAELSAKNSIFRKKLEDFFIYWQQQIEDCLREGIRLGQFSDRIRPEIYSEIILSHLQGAVLMSKTFMNINPLQKGSKEIISLLKAA